MTCKRSVTSRNWGDVWMSETQEVSGREQRRREDSKRLTAGTLQQFPQDPAESSMIALSLLIDPLSQFINFRPDLVAVIDHVLKRRRVPSILRKQFLR